MSHYMKYVLSNKLYTIIPINKGHFGISYVVMLVNFTLSEVKFYCHGPVGTTEIEYH